MKEYVISEDKLKSDINMIHLFLINSYWAKGRSLELVEKSIVLCQQCNVVDRFFFISKLLTHPKPLSYNRGALAPLLFLREGAGG